MLASMIVRTLAVLVVASLAAQPAVAAPPPAGSYRESCGSIRASGNMLRARCERGTGRMVRTQLLAYSTCVGDIANFGGQLACLRSNELPNGSWSNECANPRLVAPGMFGVDCRSRRGGRITLQIALSQCPDGVDVDGGRLVCAELRGDVILYDGAFYRGRAFAASADTPSLSRSFRGAASSARIARGFWQVCADTDYRGRCIVLRGDTPKLAALGFDNRIASLRRLPEAQYPAGSWRQSCRNGSLVGPLLTAACLDRRGRYRTSTLDLRDCRVQRADNDDGRLVCEQSEGRGEGTYEPNDSLPPGSYRESCRNAQFDGRRLRAQCRDRNRNWHDSDLDTRECGRDEEVVNDDGNLACRLHGDGGRGDEGAGEAPAGSYRNSCRSIEFDGRYLTAQCRDEHGKWRNARLDTRDCGRGEEIVNDDGDLVCRPRGAGNTNTGPLPPPPPGGSDMTAPPPQPRPGNPPPINPNAPPPNTGSPPPPPPGGMPLNETPPSGPPGAAPGTGVPGSGPPPGTSGGSNPSAGGPGGAGAPGGPPPVAGPPVAGPPSGGGPAGITLFEKPNFEGRSQTFTADTEDLTGGGWNDLAGSLKIARGRWEVCVDAKYAGRCETYGGDQASLPPELDHKISSLHRIRRDQDGGQPH